MDVDGGEVIDAVGEIVDEELSVDPDGAKHVDRSFNKWQRFLVVARSVGEQPGEVVQCHHVARVALENASQLCTRIGASIASAARGTRRGGFALLQQGSAVPASAAELVELAETARKHAGMKGFRRLAALL